MPGARWMQATAVACLGTALWFIRSPSSPGPPPATPAGPPPAAPAGPVRCGFGVPSPGRSPLWTAQTQNCRARRENRTVLCKVGVGAELGMLPIAEAVAAMDANRSMAPELRWVHETTGAKRYTQRAVHRSTELRSMMIPHVVRGLVDSSFGTAALRVLGELDGGTKATDPELSGYIRRYHGGTETGMTLAEFIRSTSEAEGHFVGCAPAEAEERSADAKAAALKQPGEGWLAAVAERARPLLLDGLVGSVLGKGCLQVSASRARLATRSDGWHSLVIQLSGGPRKALLFMPDMAEKLDLSYRDGIEGPKHHHSKIDPRNLAPRLHKVDDLFDAALAMPITLHDGDAVHLPASWWQYIESGPASNGSEPAMAISFNVVNAKRDGSPTGSFIEHPCEAKKAGS